MRRTTELFERESFCVFFLAIFDAPHGDEHASTAAARERTHDVKPAERARRKREATAEAIL